MACSGTTYQETVNKGCSQSTECCNQSCGNNNNVSAVIIIVLYILLAIIIGSCLFV